MNKPPLSDLWEKQGYDAAAVAGLMGVPEFLVDDWVSGEVTPNAFQAVCLSMLCRCDIKDIYLAILQTPLKDPDI